MTQHSQISRHSLSRKEMLDDLYQLLVDLLRRVLLQHLQSLEESHLLLKPGHYHILSF